MRRNHPEECAGEVLTKESTQLALVELGGKERTVRTSWCMTCGWQRQDVVEPTS